MRQIKKMLFALAYPFWYFFFVTIFGNLFFILVVFIAPPLFVLFLIPNQNTNEDTGGSIAIFTLLIAPIIVFQLMRIGDYLCKYYKKLGYKVRI